MFFRKIQSRPVYAAFLKLSTAYLFLLTLIIHSGVPTLEHLYPIGASQGETRTIQSIGKVDPWPPKVWISEKDVLFEADQKKGFWKVSVNEDAIPGPRLVRFYNEEGSSSPRYFLVSRTKDAVESEPNNRIKEATPIQDLPCLVHGKMDRRQDTDMFRVHLKQGDTLIARLDAYVLGSTTDALLRIMDEDSRILDWNHDRYYLDPCVQFEVPATGYYWIQVLGFPYPATSSEQLGGGDGYIYSLFLSNAAYLREVNVSTHETVQLTGCNLGKDRATPDKRDSDKNSMELVTDQQMNLILTPNIDQEQEPNDQVENATPLTSNRRGNIQSPEDIDWFSFAAAKNKWYQFEIQSFRLGYPTDLVMRIYDENKKELKSDDDSATMNDPRMEWKAPDTGNYFLKIASLTHQSGHDQVYRLLHTEKQPECELTVSAGEYNLKPGESTEIKVSIQRKYEHSAPLVIHTSRLPAGISCAPALAEKDTKEIKLILHATPSSKPFQGELKVFAKEMDQWNQRYQAGKLNVTTTVNNGVPAGYLDQVYRQVNRLWLTILPQEKTQAATEPIPKE